MESTNLTGFIQNIVDGVVHHNEPFDDSKKKWLHRYGKMEYYTDEQLNATINNLEGFFEALQELKTVNSRHIEMMAKKLGQHCGLPETTIDALIAEMGQLRETAGRAREADIARMRSEIQESKTSIQKADELYETETNLYAGLNSAIIQVQNDKAEIIQSAERRAFNNIKQQWDEVDTKLKESEKRCDLLIQEISTSNNRTSGLQDEILKLQKKVDAVKSRRKSIIYDILLIALAVLMSLFNFLTFEKLGLAWFSLLLSALFVFFRFSVDKDFGHYPELLLSLVPLAIINFEAIFFSVCCEHKWLLTFFFQTPTWVLYIFFERYIYNEYKSKAKATYHFLLVTSALLVSLAELFMFSGVFQGHGWFWAIVPFVLNILFVVHRIETFNSTTNRSRGKDELNMASEYAISLGVLAVMNTFAFCTRNGWVLVMIPIYVILYDFFTD